MPVVAMRKYEGAEYIAPINPAVSVHSCLAMGDCPQPARHRWRMPMRTKTRAWLHTMLCDAHDFEFRKCQEGQ